MVYARSVLIPMFLAETCIGKQGARTTDDRLGNQPTH